ncbi:hypothetical protein LHP98_10125 [Rhodobacter sp. Har01]|nr:hypothetical protein [Rhodobacter sp. Har01]MCB6178487.1 hypothetical protein [Rhodobacter sp. Har01]
MAITEPVTITDRATGVAVRVRRWMALPAIAGDGIGITRTGALCAGDA